MTNCKCRYNCTDFAIAASIIIGMIAATLSITGVIALTPVFLWVVGGIAVGYLAIVLILSAFGDFRGCRLALNILLIGILGTILTSIILLAIPFVAASAIGTVITGLLIASASLIFTTTACLSRCLSNCPYED